jgi:integrase
MNSTILLHQKAFSTTSDLRVEGSTPPGCTNFGDFSVRVPRSCPRLFLFFEILRKSVPTEDLTIEDLYSILGQASQLDRQFALQVFFIVFVQCTITESCSVKWNNIDLENGQVDIRGKKYALNEDAIDLLRECSREFDPYVFKHRHSSRIHIKTGIVSERLGIKLTVGTMRKVYAKGSAQVNLSGEREQTLPRMRRPSTRETQ